MRVHWICRISLEEINAHLLTSNLGKIPTMSLRECMLDYDHCQVNWFTLCLLQTTDRNDHSTKPMAYHNLKQVYELRLELVSNGY